MLCFLVSKLFFYYYYKFEELAKWLREAMGKTSIFLFSLLWTHNHWPPWFLQKKIKHTQMQKPTKPTNGDTKPPNGEPQPIIKTFVFSPSRHSKSRRTRWSHHRSLSWKVSEFWVFWFALCCVLVLRGVFVTAGFEVGYGDWRKHTTGGLSDTFQTTGR